MKAVQKGFTLIELMIVVAIIGILASVAISSYQDYTIRAQISEAITLAGSLRSELAGTVYAYSGTFSGLSNGAFGIPAATSYSGNYHDQIQIVDGVVRVRLGNKASLAVAGEFLTFSPVTSPGSIQWACSFTGPSQFVPSNCR
jgi:type IV pilus assembly protein PilA